MTPARAPRGAARAARLALALLALLCAAVALAACGSADDELSGGGASTATGPAAGAPSGTPTAEDLNGRLFVATSVDGRELVPSSRIELGFESGELGVRGGCNSIGGAYEIADGVLSFRDDPVSTLIGCEPASQEQDEWLSRLLRDGVEISAPAPDRITLSGDGVTIELREDRGSTPPPIARTQWALETIAGPDGTASNVPAGVEQPAFVIHDDGTLELFAGCNSGGGRAEVRDDGFAEFDELILTEMACGEAADALERTVLDVLSGRVALGFEGANLVTSKDGRQLTWRAR